MGRIIFSLFIYMHLETTFYFVLLDDRLIDLEIEIFADKPCCIVYYILEDLRFFSGQFILIPFYFDYGINLLSEYVNANVHHDRFIL